MNKRVNIQLLIVIFLLLFPTDFLGQNITDEGNQWNIEQGGFGIGGFTTNSFSIRVNGDTIVENITYKKLEISSDSLNTNWTFYEMIRKDSIGRILHGPSEKVLFDFSVELGDTIDINSCAVVVTEIDSVSLINGEKRKRIKVTSTDLFQNNDIWVEGIGSIRGSFNPNNLSIILCAVSDLIQNLLCFFQNGIVNYPINHDDGCWETMTTFNELSEISPVKISPNPFRNYFVISNIEEYVSISIFSVNGEKTKHFKLENTEQIEISTETWNKGIYLVQVRKSDGSLKFMKILK